MDRCISGCWVCCSAHGLGICAAVVFRSLLQGRGAWGHRSDLGGIRCCQGLLGWVSALSFSLALSRYVALYLALSVSLYLTLSRSLALSRSVALSPSPLWCTASSLSQFLTQMAPYSLLSVLLLTRALQYIGYRVPFGPGLKCPTCSCTNPSQPQTSPHVTEGYRT